jgi:hypothetical protein
MFNYKNVQILKRFKFKKLFLKNVHVKNSILKNVQI